MAYKLIDIMGIGEVYAKTLEEKAGLKTTDDLLEAAATRQGRKALAEKTGIDESRILRWVNMADLFRIKGVSEKFSNLLEYAGVDTVKELRNRNAENLYHKMREVNAERKVVARTPTLKEVQSWIEQAKQMEPKVTY